MILVLSAGLSDGSTTTRLGERIAAEAARAHAAAQTGESGRGGAKVRVIELRAYATDIAQAMLTGFPSPALQEVFGEVARAEGIVAASPVYNALPSGLFIEFFDVLPEGALDGKPVAIAATGGTPRHSLVTETIRPMFIYLHALVSTAAVYAATEDWGEHGTGFSGDDGSALVGRIRREGTELAALMLIGERDGSIARGDSRADVDPIQQEDATSCFGDFVPFDQLRAAR